MLVTSIATRKVPDILIIFIINLLLSHAGPNKNANCLAACSPVRHLSSKIISCHEDSDSDCLGFLQGRDSKQQLSRGFQFQAPHPCHCCNM